QHISADEQRIFDAAIDGQSAEASSVILLPATLNSSGKDTPDEGPVTLAGVTFIQQPSSGITLLYLPDSPDGRFLRRYASLEEARLGLFNQCAQDSWASYLAGRALLGNVRAHEVRIGQASEKRFSALIGIGTRWPASTTLAAHLLNVHMGRLIEAHRGTSRSNDALYLERYALNGPRAFNYLKMALGMVPFVGTTIALYDAWTSANQAAAAFLRGRVGDGVAELESVLLCLIDAAMDILPGASVGGTRPPGRHPQVAQIPRHDPQLPRPEFIDPDAITPASPLARRAKTATAIRQQRLSGGEVRAQARLLNRRKGTRENSAPQYSHKADPFSGYEYEARVNLAAIQPQTTGPHSGIYRHPDGDFIVRRGNIYAVTRGEARPDYAVEIPSDSGVSQNHNWRLKGTRAKTYKQPIALDENGEWNTHFAVHGTTFDGGGLGGGNVIGHVADILDPLWPQDIRERLPRWWVDRGYRRLHQLNSAADALTEQMKARFPRSKVILDRYHAATGAERHRLRPEAETVCMGDIELAERRYALLVEMIPYRHGNNRRLLNHNLSKDAGKVTDRFELLVHLVNNQIHQRFEQLAVLIRDLERLPESALGEQAKLRLAMRNLRVENLKSVETIEILMRDLNRWYERVIEPADKALLSQDVERLNRRMSEANLFYIKANHQLENIRRHENIADVSWLFFHRQADGLSLRLHRAMNSQYSLSEAATTVTQRNQVLQNCLDTYEPFLREVRIWAATYPQHLQLDELPALQAAIEKMAGNARSARLLPATRPAAGTITKKVFTTEDGETLVGVESWEPTTQVRQFQQPGKGGMNEVWEQDRNGKFRLLNPPAPAAEPTAVDLNRLIAEAGKRLNSLPDYESRVTTYAGQNMLPVDLQHMLISEAHELLYRAERLQQLDAEPGLIKSLRDSAARLKTRGRQMRTEQSLKSKKPTDGMLADLLEQKAVEIRKVKDKVDLGKRRDGRRDFMQEYEIHDLTKTPATLLWYAHFHYNKATQGFREFEKGHLKLPEHRLMTHADDPALPHADIGRQSSTLAHFESL
ncbi:dermonecrotic toxin domain-containing protein, partial [Pseudomonas koreensis]|nr:hypothetical protein [Pseudomonas koreensis]